MNLTALERYLMLNLLPVKEDILTLKIIQSLKSSLAFTEDEYKQFETVEENGFIRWGKEGLKEKEIQIGEKATDICIKALKDADKDKLLTEQHIGLYDKFVK